MPPAVAHGGGAPSGGVLGASGARRLGRLPAQSPDASAGTCAAQSPLRRIPVRELATLVGRVAANHWSAVFLQRLLWPAYCCMADAGSWGGTAVISPECVRCF
eukprot:gene52526-2145_t